GLPFLADDVLELRLAAAAVLRVGRQEHAADAVVARRRQREAQLGAPLFEEAVRRLDEEAGAVAGVLLAAAGAAVLQVEQPVDRHLDDLVRAAVVQVDDEADAAGVVLVPWVIQPLPGRGERVRHVTVSWRRRGRKWKERR